MASAKARVRKLIQDGDIAAASTAVSQIAPSPDDDEATAGKLLLAAEVALAEHDAVYALKAAKEAWLLCKQGIDRQLQADVLAVMVNGLFMKGNDRCSVQILKDAVKAAGGTLPIAQEVGDQELEASIQHVLALSHLKICELGGQSSPDDAAAAEKKALNIYRALDNKKGVATSLITIAKGQSGMFRYAEAISTASEAAQCWRAMGKAAGVVAALEILIPSQVSLGNTSGLDVVREELKLFKEAGADEVNQTILLEYAIKVAIDMGRNTEAIKMLTDVITLLEQRGDIQGKARKTLQAASLYHKIGCAADAVRLGTEAETEFSTLGESELEAEAKALVSAAQSGDADPHANKSKATLALKALVRAVESRDVPDVTKCEAELAAYGSAIEEQAISNALNNLFLKDPEAIKFLEGLGWDMESYKEKQSIYIWDKRIFYIGTTVGGMNFGPQFQSVNPARAYKARDTRLHMMNVGQLPAFEIWHDKLQWKHGLLDAGMQQFTASFWPPSL